MKDHFVRCDDDEQSLFTLITIEDDDHNEIIVLREFFREDLGTIYS